MLILAAATVFSLTANCEIPEADQVKWFESPSVTVGQTPYGPARLEFRSRSEAGNSMTDTYLFVGPYGKVLCTQINSDSPNASSTGEVQGNLVIVRTVGQSHSGCEGETIDTYRMLAQDRLERVSTKHVDLVDKAFADWEASLKSRDVKAIRAKRDYFQDNYFDCDNTRGALVGEKSEKRVFELLNARRLSGDARGAAQAMLEYLHGADPGGDVGLRNDIGFLLERGGKYREAAWILLGVVGQEGGRAVAYKNLADALKGLGDEEFAKVVRALGGAKIQLPNCLPGEEPKIRFQPPSSQGESFEVSYYCGGSHFPKSWVRKFERP